MGRNRIGSWWKQDLTGVSQDKVWGVPIPIFYDDETNKEIFIKEVHDRICNIVRKGSGAWIELSPEELIGEEFLVKYNLKDKKLRKETNIMDVFGLIQEAHIEEF